ncbi:MAG TPA: citrate synthase [Pyrinomonadaceae bacterium]|nr:citrate synthase [Pyrinomonadaceae bacterium]HWP55771.1 citrate synthase [Pyrinomonadaceae bacterium]
MDKANGSSAGSAVSTGLRGVVAAASSIGDVNGEKGELIYQGVNIHDLATKSTFEEVVFLLWNGRLPKKAELDELRQNLAASYELQPEIIEVIKGMAARVPSSADPMDRLRTVVSALAMFDPEARDLSREASIRVATRLTARFPTIVAAIDRARNNLEIIQPKPELNIATNFLYMLKGEMPDEFDAHVLDVALILQADHELNASTFTARVVAGTLADMYSAVTAALGALSGPLHGGANTAIMKILLEIGDVDRVEGYVSDALSKKKKIMGFGHAVYKTEDPRATHLRRFSKEMGERKGDSKWYEITAKLEAIMKREKNLLPNVDAYSASTYYMMGIPLDLYTPIFAISRISGWTAHILEQYADNKLIRPRAEYVGPRNVPYVPIDER